MGSESEPGFGARHGPPQDLGPATLDELPAWLIRAIKEEDWKSVHGSAEDRQYHLGRRHALAEVCRHLRRLLGWPDPGTRR